MRINKIDREAWIDKQFAATREDVDNEELSDDELYQMAIEEYYSMIDEAGDMKRDEDREREYERN